MNEIMLGREDYKCFDLLKEKLQDEKFKNIIEKGIREGKITGFTEDMWSLIDNQNVRIISNFTDIFKDGYNIGGCTTVSKQLSYSYDNVYICGGVLDILRGTKNSINGEHTWLEVGNKIIDTSLMLVIDLSLKDDIGYKESNRYNPNTNPIYCATKEFTNDENLKINRHK